MKWFKFDVFLGILVIVGAFLRFYKIDENIVFHGELGSNYLAIKNFLLSGYFPLIGPATSHPWLSFGPIYYWLMAPLFAVFDFDPRIGTYFFASLGTLLIVINYIFVKKLFNRNIALISSLLITFSPLYLVYAREARFFSFVLILFYFFYYFLIKVLSEKKYFFWFGFFYGSFFSFHYSPLIYLPVIIIYFWESGKEIKISNICKIFLGFIAPNITIIVSDLLGKSSIVASLLVWLPYRVLGFLNIYPKNNLTEEVAKLNFESVNIFLNSLLLPESIKFIPMGFLILSLSLVFIFREVKIVPMSIKILLITLATGLIALFVHGDFPQHYFLPLIPVCIILISISFSIIFEKYTKISIVLIVLFVCTNIFFYISDNWFYKYKELRRNFVNYQTQFSVSEKIVADSKGKPFSLKRVGQGDEFEDNFAQNYIYLMWYFGNEPVKDANLIYTVFENVKIDNPSIVLENIQVKKNEK